MHPMVILNTSPLQYLHQLGLLDVLESLFSRIYVPAEVVEELDGGKLEGVHLPDLQDLEFIKILPPQPISAIKLARDLGNGETAVILHGLENPGCLIVLDDLLARRTARSLGVKLTGTAGILITAKRKGVIQEIKPYLDQLAQLGFYLAPSHKSLILEKAGEQPS
ncbi:DUF3368 domain-containing protein [Desulfococcus sp.]|uniref:DUF3368 domain-containing protein n=1 Tax=Desulfococcus sp. TaxID=2025834 RepID=UPI00359337F2